MLLVWLKKRHYDTKVTEIENKLNNHNHDKYITTPEFITIDAEVFNARLSRASLMIKTDFGAKLSRFNRKVIEDKAKPLLVQNELKKLKTFDSSYFRGKIHFEEDGVQNYLIFQPITWYFKVNTTIGVSDYVLSWKSKGSSAETIKSPTTSDNSLTSAINFYYAAKITVKFSESCLAQPKILCNHEKVVKIYIVYEIGASGSNNSDPTLKNCLFGAVNLSKTPDIVKYEYSGYGTGFDRRSSFSFPAGGFGQNLLICGAESFFRY